MVNILQIMVGTGAYGGAEQFVLSYYENMDKTKIRYNFLFLQQNVLQKVKKNYLNESRIDVLGTWNNHPSLFSCIKTTKELIKYLKKNEYEIVHINSGIIKVELCCLIAAKIVGVKVRIAHSHTSKPITKSNVLKTALIRKLATDYFACSEAAGIYLFGERGIQSKKFKVIVNAVDLSKYKYNTEKSLYIKQRENTTKKIIFGHIGRFVKVKNQRYLIDVFKKIFSKNSDVQLWMIGDGELFYEIQSYINECGLSECVRLFGERDDVAELMQAMDALIFPSIFEGLSMVVVESQAAGLNTFVSDNISKEHKLSDHIWFLPLDAGTEYWSDIILEKMKNYEKSTMIDKLIKNGYDITFASKKLEDYYLDKAGIKNEK